MYYCNNHKHSSSSLLFAPVTSTFSRNLGANNFPSFISLILPCGALLLAIRGSQEPELVTYERLCAELINTERHCAELELRGSKEPEQFYERRCAEQTRGSYEPKQIYERRCAEHEYERHCAELKLRGSKEPEYFDERRCAEQTRGSFEPEQTYERRCTEHKRRSMDECHCAEHEINERHCAELFKPQILNERQSAEQDEGFGSEQESSDSELSDISEFELDDDDVDRNIFIVRVQLANLCHMRNHLRARARPDPRLELYGFIHEWLTRYEEDESEDEELPFHPQMDKPGPSGLCHNDDDCDIQDDFWDAPHVASPSPNQVRAFLNRIHRDLETLANQVARCPDLDVISYIDELTDKACAQLGVEVDDARAIVIQAFETTLTIQIKKREKVMAEEKSKSISWTQYVKDGIEAAKSWCKTSGFKESLGCAFSQTTIEKFQLAFRRYWGTVRSTALRTVQSVAEFLKTLLDYIAAFVSDHFRSFLELVKDTVVRYAASVLQSALALIDTETLVVLFIIVLNLFSIAARENTVMRFAMIAINACVVYMYSHNSHAKWIGAVMTVMQGMMCTYDRHAKAEFTPQFEARDKKLIKQFTHNLFYIGLISWCGVRGLAVPSDSKSINDFLVRFGHLGRAMQTWDMITNKVEIAVDQGMEIVFRLLLKQPYVSSRSLEAVDELYSEVLELTKLENQLLIGRDHKMSLRIEMLYYQYLGLMRLYSNDFKARKTLESISFVIHNMYQQVVDKNPKAHRLRAEPTVILLTGKTGVGKTSMLHALQVDLLKICGKWTPERGTDGLIYARCSEQEFWDGYAGQPICVVDEFMQRIDTLQNPNIELFELIRAANIFPYALHSAALNEKANNSFKSDFMVLTSNIEQLRAPSIQSVEAVERRIHLRYDISVIPEVATGGGPHPWKLCPDKLAKYREEKGLDTTDMSHYRFTVKGGGYADEKYNVYTYDEFIVQVSQVYRRNTAIHEKMTTATNTRAERPLPPGTFSIDERWNAFKPQIEMTDVERGISTCGISLYEYANLDKATKTKYVQQGGRVFRSLDHREVFGSFDQIVEFCKTHERDFSKYSDVDRIELVNILRDMKTNQFKHVHDLKSYLDSKGILYGEGRQRMQWTGPDRPKECVYSSLGEFVYLNYQWKFDINRGQMCYMKTGWAKKEGHTQKEEEYWTYAFGFEYLKRQEEAAFIRDQHGRFNWRLWVHTVKSAWWEIRTTQGYYNWKRVAEPILIIAGLTALGFAAQHLLRRYLNYHLSVKKVCAFLFIAYSGTTSEMPMVSTTVFSLPLILHALNLLNSWRLGRTYCDEACEQCMKLKEIEYEKEYPNMYSFVSYLFEQGMSAKEVHEFLFEFQDDEPDLFEDMMRGRKTMYHPKVRMYFYRSNFRVRPPVEMPESNEDVEYKKRQRKFESNESVELPKRKQRFESNEGVEIKKKQPTFEFGDGILRILQESNNDVEIRKRRPRFEADKEARKIFKGVHAEGLISKAADDLRLALYKNLYLITIFYDDENGDRVQQQLGHVFIIKGNVALINAHYLVAMRQFMHENKNVTNKFYVCIRQHEQGAGATYSFDQFFKTLKAVYRGETCTELFTFKTPAALPCGKDFTKHLITTEELRQLHQGVRQILVTKEKLQTGKWVTVSREGRFRQVRTITMSDIDDPSLLHTYPNTAVYDICTKAGDCGSPVLIASDQFKNKLLGFHIGGSDGGDGCASIVTASDLTKHVEGEIAEPLETSYKPQGDGPEFDKFPAPMRSGAFTILGVIPEDQIPHQPMQTKLQPSPIFNQVVETKVAPAKMAPPLKEDGPMVRGIMKYAAESSPLEQDHLQSAVTSYKNMLFRLPALQNEREVLSYEDAVRGVEGNPFFPPCKRSTSAGWPWCLDRHSRGKEKWLGADQWDLTSKSAKEMRQEVEKMERMCREGIIPEVYYVDTLKDEKRPIEKVKAGKTRVFSAAPLPFTILFRKYFAGFLAFMMRNKIANECAVGTNPYSTDWKSIVSNIDVFGSETMVAGDFSNFDGTVNYYIMDAILNIINEFYADSPANKRVRRVLWQNIAKSKHILGPFVYQLMHSQPSGNPSTAVTNSMYNSIATRYCYSFLVGSAITFNDNIRMIAYGDDNIISVSPKIANKFTPKLISYAFSTFGMEYTSEIKGVQFDEFRSIGDLTFLKRRFDYDAERRYWFAPLSLDSLGEMTNWIKKSKSEMTALRDNLQQIVCELYFHEEATFIWFTERMNCVLKEIGEMPISFMDYDAARDLIAVGRFHEICETSANMRWAYVDLSNLDTDQMEGQGLQMVTPQSKIKENIREQNLFLQTLNLSRTPLFRILYH